MQCTAGDPRGVIAAVRRKIDTLDRDLPVFQVRTMDEIAGTSARNREFSAMLLGLFALPAPLLAAIGLYGVLAYGVSQRTAGIGSRLVLLQGMKPALAGIAAGIVAAALGARLLSDMLFHAPAGVTLTLLLLVVAAIACFIPAARATRIAPTLALRRE